MMSRILCTISIPLVCSIPTVYLFPSRFAIPSPSSSPPCPISFHFILFLVLFCPSLGSFHFLSFLFFPILPIKSSLQLPSPCPFRLFPSFIFFSACTDEFQFKSITWNQSIRKSFFNFVLPLFTLDYFYNDGKRYSLSVLLFIVCSSSPLLTWRDIIHSVMSLRFLPFSLPFSDSNCQGNWKKKCLPLLHIKNVKVNDVEEYLTKYTPLDHAYL